MIASSRSSGVGGTGRSVGSGAVVGMVVTVLVGVGTVTISPSAVGVPGTTVTGSPVGVGEDECDPLPGFVAGAGCPVGCGRGVGGGGGGDVGAGTVGAGVVGTGVARGTGVVGEGCAGTVAVGAGWVAVGGRVVIVGDGREPLTVTVAIADALPSALWAAAPLLIVLPGAAAVVTCTATISVCRLLGATLSAQLTVPPVLVQGLVAPVICKTLGIVSLTFTARLAAPALVTCNA